MSSIKENLPVSYYKCIFLFCLFILGINDQASAQSQRVLDSLWRVWEDRSLSDSIRLEALAKNIQEGHRVRQLDSSLKFSNLLISRSQQLRQNEFFALGLLLKGNIFFRKGEFPTAKILMDSSRQIADQIRDTSVLAKAIGGLGIVITFEGKFAEAYNLQKRALTLFANMDDSSGIANSYNSIGLIHNKKGQYDSAIHYFNKGLDIATQIDNKKVIAVCLGNIPQVYESQGKIDLALDAYQQVIDFNRQAKDSIGLAISLGNYAGIHAHLGNFEKAIQLTTKASEIFKDLGWKRKQTQMQANLGVLNMQFGKVEIALQQFFQSRQQFESFGDYESVANSLVRIGTIYSSQKDKENALRYFQEAYKISEKIGQKRRAASALRKIGAVYRQQDSFKLALFHYQKALEIDTDIKYKQGIQEDYQSLGYYYKDQKDYDQALKFQKKSLQMANELQNKHTISVALNAVGVLYRYKGEYKQSIEYCEKALAIAQEIDRKGSIRTASFALYRTYQKTNQHKEALAAYKQYTKVKELVRNDANKRALFKQEYKYQYQKEALQDSLAFVREQTAAEIAFLEELKLRNYAIFGTIILGVIVFFFFRNRQELKLQHEKVEQRKLKELDEVKNRLYTNITHEFRTPLTVIQGMSKKVLEHPDKWTDRGMEMIQRNSAQLLQLVNQMLDLSKLESGELKLNQVQGDIVPFIYYLTESFHSYAELQGVDLRTMPGPEQLVMDYDPDRITEIVSNLLSNAIKFTPENGQVSVSLSQEGKQFYLKVEDNGIGIPEAQLPYIFDRFYQADDSSTRSGEGTGVGLALTRELVKLMGGSIEVESSPGIGTAFTVRLPITHQAPLDEQAASFAPDKSSILPLIAPGSPLSSSLAALTEDERPLLLVVEDNEDVITYLQSCLEVDYRLAVARDGQEGIEKAFELVPDLIITDVMMPRKDGFELCYELKHDMRSSHIPVIMLTARADVDAKLDGLRKGADAYLTKPFNEEELLLRVGNLLDLRERMQARYTSLEQPLSTAQEEPELQQEDAFILQFREIVEQHIDKYDLDVSFLCETLNLSRTPLHNKLKALTGMSTTEYVRFIRLSRAQELLRDESLNISEVSYAVGFQDPNYFTRKFRELFGVTPKAWREGSE